jgi:hypothetical protein
VDDERPDGLHALGFALQMQALQLLQLPLTFLIAAKHDGPAAFANALEVAFGGLGLVAGLALCYARRLAPGLLAAMVVIGVWALNRSSGSVLQTAIEWGTLPLAGLVAWSLSSRRRIAGPRPRAMLGGYLVAMGAGTLASAIGLAASIRSDAFELGAGPTLVWIACLLLVTTMSIRAGLELVGVIPRLDPGRSRFTHYVVSSIVSAIVINLVLLAGSWRESLFVWWRVIGIVLWTLLPLLARAFAGPPPLDGLEVRRSDARFVVGWMLVAETGTYASQLVHPATPLATMLHAALAPACLAAGVAALLGWRLAMRGIAVFGAVAAVVLAIHAMGTGDRDALSELANAIIVAASCGVLVWLGAPDPDRTTLEEVFA